MKKLLIAAAVAALFLAGAPALRAQDKFLETPYYPVKVGSTWTFKVGNSEQKVQIRVGKHEKIGDTTCAVLEAIVSGTLTATEYVSPQADGVYRLRGQNKDVVPPLRFFKLPPKKGDTWKIDSKVGSDSVKGDCTMDEGEVTVPAGKYQVTIVTNTLEVGTKKVSTTYYFAKDIGMVKQVANIDGVDIVLELEKFEAGK